MARKNPPRFTVLATNHRSFWSVTVDGIPKETTAERHGLIGARAAGLIRRHLGLEPGQYTLTVEYDLGWKKRAG